MIARKIGVTRRIVCAAPAYLAEHGTPTTLDALLDHNCLFPPIYERYWPLVENGKTRRLRVRGNVASNYFSLLHHIALAGMGVVRLPDFFIRDDIASGRLVPILMENNSASEPINALYPSSRGQIPRVKAFLPRITHRDRRSYSCDQVLGVCTMSIRS